MADVAVLVPVMRRPWNAQPFMASLRSTCGGRAAVYVLADPDDVETTIAWRDAGADGVYVGPWGTFARKCNAGYRLTVEPWLFLTGDDVVFHLRWLDEALEASADAHGADVVGTNDLGNPRVLAGEHATHMLVRRIYADEVGASWDGPGVLCHEGYVHNYVDDELVIAAKQRDRWVAAGRAVVEHRHPLWGDTPDDEVYALGRSSAPRDRRLFESRRAAYAPAGV